MNEKEIKDIKKSYKLASKFNSDFNTELDNKVFDYIEHLRQENKQLKENYECIKKQRDDITKNATEQLERSIDDWSKLKEWLRMMYDTMEFPKYDTGYGHARDVGYSFALKDVLSKIQEIRGDNK